MKDGDGDGDDDDQFPLFDDKKRGARNTDPPTSHKANAAVNPRRGSQQWKILTAYIGMSTRGLTDEEAGKVSGLSAHPRCCYWKRCSELRAGKFIAPTGRTAVSSAGSEMMLCVITERGIAALEGR
jgi:hypothetical protein